MDERIIEFFKEQGLYDEKFFEFIKGKVFIVPNTTDIFWYGCHPLLERSAIKDIRVVVPEIQTEKDILINIHEFTHALELYQELGQIYEERIEEREQKAKNMELIYLKRKARPIS